MNDIDPTDPMRMKASLYPHVDEGTACTQSSFKANKKAFLFVGEQGGRYKAMFKLKESISEAAELASQEPNNFEVGKFGWVTARFTAEEPMPQPLWERWLDESYGLSVAKKKRK
ncbi:MAG: MmcQ/YjbR family DNA-binding protein [Chloroflexota bacterium]